MDRLWKMGVSREWSRFTRSHSGLGYRCAAMILGHNFATWHWRWRIEGLISHCSWVSYVPFHKEDLESTEHDKVYWHGWRLSWRTLCTLPRSAFGSGSGVHLNVLSTHNTTSHHLPLYWVFCLSDPISHLAACCLSLASAPFVFWTWALFVCHSLGRLLFSGSAIYIHHCAEFACTPSSRRQVLPLIVYVRKRSLARNRWLRGFWVCTSQSTKLQNSQNLPSSLKAMFQEKLSCVPF